MPRLPLIQALALTGAIAFGVAALAQTSSMNQGDHAMQHGAAMSEAGHDAHMREMMDAMMGVEPTGDADADFLLMMIPHHEGALAMSEAALADLDDPEVIALAEDIIAAQAEEIELMRAMLERLGHPIPAE